MYFPVSHYKSELQIIDSSDCKIINSNFPKTTIKNSNNIKIQDSQGPIDLYNSQNCIIKESRISISLVNSHQNKIFNNSISIGMSGEPLLFNFENSCNNLIHQNYINCKAHKLISMTGNTNKNLFIANNFANYAYFEPTFNHSGTNTFYYNNFFNANWLQTDPDFTVSKWDNGKEGNYWSNYNGTDANHDGIGDQPHIIDLHNQDLYPLMEPVDIQQIDPPNLPSYP